MNDPHALFMSRLQDQHPELYEQMTSPVERKRKWNDIVGPEDSDESNCGGFSFGFGEDDLEDDK